MHIIGGPKIPSNVLQCNSKAWCKIMCMWIASSTLSVKLVNGTDNVKSCANHAISYPVMVFKRECRHVQ